MVFDQRRANEGYIDGLFQNNDFATVRRLIKGVYKQLPKGWSKLGENGLPPMTMQAPPPPIAKEVEPLDRPAGDPLATNVTEGFSYSNVPGQTQGPIADGFRIHRRSSFEVMYKDPTLSNVGVVVSILGFCMLAAALFATFSPFWTVASASATSYGPRSSVGASLWVIGYVLSGPPSLQAPFFLSDCKIGEPGISMDGVTGLCGAMLASQIFSVFLIVTCIACTVVGCMSVASIISWLKYMGVNAAIYATLCFAIYFASVLRFAIYITKKTCVTVGARPSNCDADATSVSFWIMVSLVPMGMLHAWICHWRYTVYNQVVHADASTEEIDKKNSFIRRGLLALSVTALVTLIAGAVQGAADVKKINTILASVIDTCDSSISPSNVENSINKTGPFPRIPGQIAPLCRTFSGGAAQPQFIPIGDVNKDSFPDFIAYLEPTPFSIREEVYLVWGQNDDGPLEPTDFTKVDATSFVKITTSSFPTRPEDAKALGDVTGDGIDDFLLVYIESNQYLGYLPSAQYNRVAYVIPGRASWADTSVIAIEDLYSLRLRVLGIPSVFNGPSPKAFLNRISVGADLDGDGILDWCTTGYSAKTFGFCVYGAAFGAQLSIDCGMNQTTSASFIQDPNLGFALDFPTDCTGGECYYDAYTTKSVIGSVSYDDIIVTNHNAPSNIDRNIWITDGRSRADFGSEFNPVSAALKIITASSSLQGSGKITDITPLGDMGSGVIFAVAYQAAPALGTQGFSFIGLTPSTAPTTDMRAYPYISVPVTQTSNADFTRLRGGSAVLSQMFDYDNDGKADLLLDNPPYNTMLKIVLNRAISNANLAGAVTLQSLDPSSYRDWKWETGPTESLICGKGELCLNYWSSTLPMIMFSAGAQDIAGCSDQFTPSLIYMSSPGTRIALGLFGFLSFTALVLVALFFANKKLREQVIKRAEADIPADEVEAQVAVVGIPPPI